MKRGLVIRTQEIGGRIVALGTDAARGIVVEQPDFQADSWGPSRGAFVLKRSPRVQWPDLIGGAPVWVEERGVPVWLGRIKNTPMTDGGIARQISVQCEGQQYKLDDDVYERVYVHTRLSDFVDSRSMLGTPLGSASAFLAGSQVSATDGAIALMWPNGVPVGALTFTGATLDLGAAVAKRVVITYESSNNAALALLYCRCSDIADGGANGAGADDVVSGVVNSAGAGPAIASGTCTAPRRYINIFMYHSFGSPETATVDVWFKITSVLVFADAAYESGNASTLKASTILNDALDRATLGLSADRSLITPTSFNIPDFAMTGPSTPREAINGANAFHGMQPRVRADNRVEYRLLPSLPTIEVGSDSRFNEASAGDISEVYTGVLVKYTDPAGVAQRLYRAQPATLEATSALQPTNPTAAANTTGWAATLGTLSRDIGVFDSTPASFKVAVTSGAGNLETSSWAAAPVPARAYIASFSLRTDVAAALWAVRVRDANGQVAGVASLTSPAINTWIPVRMAFTLQTAGAPILNASIENQAGGAVNGWLDSIIITEITPTIIDRWGFKRTKILDTGMALTAAGAQQIADVFLAAHRTTPLKGELIVTGDGRARRAPSGQGMLAGELLTCVGDLVRMTHLIDPDTGKLGRIGRIANVSWDAAANVATLAIDSTSSNFEAMLARLAIITSQVR